MRSSSEERELLRQRLSRRRLLKAGAVAAIGAAGLGLAACASEDNAEFGSGGLPATVFWRRWFGPADAPAKVQWDGNLETLGACAPNKVTTPLATHEEYIEASAWDPVTQRAFFGCRTPSYPFPLIRFNPADNSYTASIGNASSRWCNSLAVTGSIVYAGHRDGVITTASAVSAFSADTDPPELIETYFFGDYPTTALATDGTYLFIGNTHGQILLVRLADMTLIDTLQLATDYSAHPHALKYDSASGFLFATFAGIEDPNGYAYKLYVDTETDPPTLVEDAELQTGHTMADDLAVADGWLWVTEELDLPGGNLIRIPVDTFDSHEHVPCGPAGSSIEGIMADSDGVYIWVIGHNYAKTDSHVARIKISDLTYERIWLADDEAAPDDIIQYAPGKYLIALWAAPSKIINLTNPFPVGGLDKPISGYNYSYWASLRAYAETTPDVSISDLKAYTDGENNLGTGWSARGGIATEYTQPTGVEGVSGDVLNTTNYPTLEATAVDIFGWTSGSPKTIEGSLTNPNTGDVGVAGTDKCFLVVQLKASTSVAEGVSNTEVLTVSYTDSALVLKTASIRGKVVLVPQTFYQGLSGALAVAGVTLKD